MSVEDCMRLAREVAPEVRVAAMARQAARFDSTAAARNGRPTVQLQGNVHAAPDGFYDPAYTNLGDYALQISVAVPLLDGGIRSRARDRATLEAHRAGHRLEASARAAATRAGSLAIEILRLREQLETRTQALARLDELIELLGSRAQGGMALLSDLDRLRIERDGVRSTLESTRTDRTLVSRELAVLLGNPPTSDAPPIREPLPTEEWVAADSSRLEEGISGLPDVLLAADDEAAASLDEAEAARSHAMVVEGGIDAGFAGTDLTRIVPPDLLSKEPDANLGDRLRRDLGASASVSFTRPLFDATAGPSLDARRSARRAASLARTAASDAASRAARDLVDRQSAAGQRIRTEEDIVSRAEMSLLRMRNLYVAGSAGVLDLLDAQRALDEARNRLADARADWRVLAIEAEMRS